MSKKQSISIRKNETGSYKMRITVGCGKKFSATRIQIGLMTYNLECATDRGRFIWRVLKQQGGYLHAKHPVFRICGKEKGLDSSGGSKGESITECLKERGDEDFRISRRDVELMNFIPLMENSREEWILPVFRVHGKLGKHAFHIHLLTANIDEARKRALLVLRTLNLIAGQQDEKCVYSINSGLSCSFYWSNSAPGSIRFYDYP